MKAKTIIKRIKEKRMCSIKDCELLTKALHRENLLSYNKAVRFMPLYGMYDIVNSDLFLTGNFNSDLCENNKMTIDEIEERFFKRRIK